MYTYVKRETLSHFQMTDIKFVVWYFQYINGKMGRKLLQVL